MIIQTLIDAFRDVIMLWIRGFNSLVGGVDANAAGEGIGTAAAGASHVLALFIDGGIWPVLVSTWLAWLSVWLITGLVAIIGRRLSS